MAEKCLMVATLAALVFHPSSTIRCFKPKQSPISPQNDRKPKPSTPIEKNGSLKARKKLHCPSKSTLSRSCSWRKDNVIEPRPRPSPPLPCSPNPKQKMNTLLAKVKEVGQGEPTFRVVKTIFQSGWADEARNEIKKILKMNHNEEVLDRFEEYRKLVKSKATKSTNGASERLLVDGNEVLQFLSTTITCNLGFNGVVNFCNKKSCGFCRILGYSDSAKARPMLVFENSCEAHEMSRKGCELKVESSNNAILICRVIAGRVARYREGEMENAEKDEYDSVVVQTGDRFDGFQEIMVCNSSAILPCYVVIYKVS